MEISYNWLKEYINIDLPHEEVAKTLINIGLEVESIETFQSVKGGLEGLVIGEVKACQRHPNADRLSVTKVDVGSDRLLDIVCGAPNVAAGQKVVVALEGTVLYKGDESFTIKKGKIRGEVSEGMICAEDEIGLGTSHDGIMVLDASARVGSLAKDYFGVVNDVVFVIGLTANRIDAASHYGVARDLAAALSLNQSVTLKKPSVNNFRVDNHGLPIQVIIENKKSCRRYSGVSITGVKIAPSPAWLQNRLKAIGLKPINNVVDVTNYVLHECGQPLHAFDAVQIKGNKVVVRNMEAGSEFITLDGVTRKLAADDLMICNAHEGMCIAGVFGGLHSGISETTTDIFLESAYFDPVSVRRTSKRHLLYTDSSFRFERGADPSQTVWALKRAALLIKELAGGQISSEIVDVYPYPFQHAEVELEYTYLDRLVGKRIPRETVQKIVLALEMNIDEQDADGLILHIPSYRVDVTRPADVIEEILRIYGYNNIEIPDAVNSTLSYTPKPDRERLQNLVADMLTANGWNEIMCNSLTKSAHYSDLATYPADKCVRIVNPLSSDLDVLRQTLLFGSLETALFNQNRKEKDLKLYEFGNCYYYNASSGDGLKKYSENMHLSLLISGNTQPESWRAKQQASDFYNLKTWVDNILKRLSFDLATLDVTDANTEIFGYGLTYSIKGKTLAEFGSIHRKLLNKNDIQSAVFFADLHWDNILAQYKNTTLYHELPKYPSVRRDLALVLDKQVRFDDVRRVALRSEQKLLQNINIFDVYEGENIGADKKSYAVSYTLVDENATLTDERVDKVMTKLIKAYETELKAIIRK